jgi:hypothetical protein
MLVLELSCWGVARGWVWGFVGWGRVAPGGCFVQLLICWVGLGLGLGCFVVETRGDVQPHIPHIYSVARHNQSQVTLQVL